MHLTPQKRICCIFVYIDPNNFSAKMKAFKKASPHKMIYFMGANAPIKSISPLLCHYHEHSYQHWSQHFSLCTPTQAQNSVIQYKNEDKNSPKIYADVLPLILPQNYHRQKLQLTKTHNLLFTPSIKMLQSTNTVLHFYFRLPNIIQQTFVLRKMHFTTTLPPQNINNFSTIIPPF